MEISPPGLGDFVRVFDGSVVGTVDGTDVAGTVDPVTPPGAVVPVVDPGVDTCSVVVPLERAKSPAPA